MAANEFRQQRLLQDIRRQSRPPLTLEGQEHRTQPGPHLVHLVEFTPETDLLFLAVAGKVAGFDPKAVLPSSSLAR